MSRVSKRDRDRLIAEGVRKAVELYKRCRANDQSEELALESVLLTAQATEWGFQ